MKKKGMKIWVMVVTFAALVLSGVAAHAGLSRGMTKTEHDKNLAAIGDKKAEHCIVTTKVDNSKAGGSVRSFLAWYNESDSSYRACKRWIDFDTGKIGEPIDLKKKMVIETGATGDAPFFFGPDDGQNITFKVEEGKYKAGDEEECVLTVKGKETIIQNITIESMNSGFGLLNGICVEAPNYVYLRNVRVNGVSLSGVVIGENSKYVYWEGADGYSILNGEHGIYIKGTAGNDRYIEIPTKTDAATVSNPDYTQFLTTGNDGYNIYSAYSGYIDAEQLWVELAGNGMIRGKVLNCIPGVTDCSCSDKGVSVEKVYVYRQDEDPIGNTNANAYQFIGVGGVNDGLGTKWNEGYFKINVDVALNKNDKLFLVPYLKGGYFGTSSKSFDVAVRTAKDGIEKDCYSGGGSSGGEGDIQALVAAIGDQACSSQRDFWVFDNWNEDLDSDKDTIKDVVEMRMELIQDTTGTKIAIHQVAECSFANPIVNWTTPDTDGDGIPDKDELKCANGKTFAPQEIMEGAIPNSTCAESVRLCGECPDEVDTDGAGGTVWYFKVKAGTKYLKEFLVDTDRDGRPNVNDPDDDQDGVPTVEEDRSKLYKDSSGRSYNAYFMMYGDSIAPLYQEGGGLIRCDDNKNVGYSALKGIAYGVYKVLKDKTQATDEVDYKYKIERIGLFEPQDILEAVANGTEFTFDGLNAKFGDEEFKIMTLACVASPLISEEGDLGTNFNNFVDGDSGLEDPEDCSNHLDDKDIECKRNICVSGEIIKYVDPEYLTSREENSKLGLVMSKEDPDMPKLWYELKTGKITPRDVIDKCGDHDNDGIASCVEGAFASKSLETISLCPDKLYKPCQEIVDKAGNVTVINPELCDSDSTPSKGDTFTMSAYLADSDGDEILDGFPEGVSGISDICPMSYGKGVDNENLSLENSQSLEESLSCDPYKIYTMNEASKLLAFFLDRDGDGIKDIFEYIDGVKVEEDFYALPQEEREKLLETAWNSLGSGKPDKKEQSMTTPTDPIRYDSDFDGLTDLAELREFLTLPYYNDSDHDQLTDGEEVSGGVFAPASLGKVGEASYGCHSEDYKYSTDPNKADTDGDGINDKIELKITHTSPIDIDSDGDTLCDGIVSVNGCTGAELITLPTLSGNYQNFFADNEVSWDETSPCNKDSDGDGWQDGHTNASKKDNCPKIANLTNNCSGEEFEDQDNDNLPDSLETADQMGTDPTNPDSDGDGLCDGCCQESGVWMGELCNAYSDVIMYEYPKLYMDASRCQGPDYLGCDTDPNNKDTDDDGVSDGDERKYHGERNGIAASPSNPWDEDTDHDCIIDGFENKNQDSKWDPDETLVASPNNNEWAVDTDGDGSWDGKKSNSYGYYEDLNCNGIFEPQLGETSALMYSTDGDPYSDTEEWEWGGGGWNMANAGRPLTQIKRGGGCSMSGETGNMTTLMMMLGVMLGVAVLRKRIKKVEKVK